MNTTPDLTGPSAPPASGGPAKQLVVLLHGYGADGQDLIGLAPHLAEVLPDAAFHAPDAPSACEMAPFGRQWFSLMDRSTESMWRGVTDVAPAIDRFIDRHLDRYGLTARDLALIGFSQGTMLSLHVAPRRHDPPACVVGFSGLLIGSEHLPGDVVSRPPVLLIHGEVDEVVPIQALDQATDGLRAADIPVTALRRPGLPHGIDGEGLVEAARFLRDHLAVDHAVDK